MLKYLGNLFLIFFRMFNIKEFLYYNILETKKMENQKTKAELSKEYRIKNKPIICERCGGKVHYGQKNAHERSKKHLYAIENNFYFKKENI